MSAALVRWSFRPSCRSTSPAADAAVSHRSRLTRDESGAVALLAALSLTLVCGAVGLAIDIGFWYRTTRAMQNAADAAAVAAARDGRNDTYAGTGKAIAARYGFVDGADDRIRVNIDRDQPCPSGGTNCFKATIHDNAAPQFFSKVLGVDAPALSASATASLIAGPSIHNYCVLALATSGASPAILTDGSPFADLNRCNIMSNTDMTCNGHDLNADSADAAGINNGCGDAQSRNSHVPRVDDPFAGLAANISPSSASVARAASAPTDISWPAGTKSLRSVEVIPGNLVVDGNTTITTPSTGSVVYIRNGTLDVNGTLTTAAGSGVTFVFTGTNGAPSTSPSPYPTGRGTLDISAPPNGSGPWAGVAIYIDPNTTGPQTIIYAGNSPTWKITGLVYMPHASLTVSGAVGKSSNGGACLSLVVDNIRINGTGSILMRPEDCQAAGVPLPTNRIRSGSPALVL